MKIKKIFIILLIALICFVSFSFGSAVNAQSYLGYEFPDLPAEFDTYEYKVMLYDSKSFEYILVLSDMPFVYQSNCSLSNGLQCILCNYKNMKSFFWNPKTSEQFILKSSNSNANVSYLHYYLKDATKDRALIYANHDVKDSSTNTIFFYKTPLTSFTTMQYSIGAIFFQQVQGVTSVVLVIGLVIFSMVLLVSFVRLRN